MDCPNPKRRRAAPAAVPALPEDAIVDILERVPARSIHRFKCVSQRWCDLISDTVHRKRFPQTLEGFFFGDAENYFSGDFVSLPGITAPLFDPSLSFLTKLPENKNIKLLRSCGGLLLFGHGADWGIDGNRGYIVCNPATEQWVAVPSAGCPAPKDRAPTYINFDPAVSPHFHLIHLWQNDNTGELEVRAYSSEIGVWIDRTGLQMAWQEQGDWPEERWEQWYKDGATSMGNTFVNGMMHFIIFHRRGGNYQIVGLGWEEDKVSFIRWPGHHGCSALFLGQSQGNLYCIGAYHEGKGFYQCGICIWELQDYDTEKWVHKHSVSFLKLFGQNKCRVHADYNVLAIHPDCKWVFLVHHCKRKLVAYDMDRNKVHVLRTLRHTHGFCTPYIPYYSKLSLLGNKN